MDKKQFAKYLDLANHHATATPDDIRLLCQKVLEFGFATAFVNACYVALAREVLKDRGRVGTVISFPLGQDTKEAKIFSSLEALENGADELDICMNIGLFKAGFDDQVLQEMKKIVLEAKEKKQDAIVKFIIGAEYLSDSQVKRASELVLLSGADFVKTNSGMGKRGVIPRDVKLAREAVGDKIRVKGAGGIRTKAQALELIKAGADRLGTSKSVEIILEK